MWSSAFLRRDNGASLATGGSYLRLQLVTMWSWLGCGNSGAHQSWWRRGQTRGVCCNRFDTRVRRGGYRHGRNQDGAHRANTCVYGLIAGCWGRGQGCIIFEISKHQGVYEMADVVDVGKDPERPGEYWVRIAWVGLEDEDPTWEPVSMTYEDAPKYLEHKLKKIMLNRATKQALKHAYGKRLWHIGRLCSVGLRCSFSMDEPSMCVWRFCLYWHVPDRLILNNATWPLLRLR